MPALVPLQLFSNFVPKTHPLCRIPFCRKDICSTARTFFSSEFCLTKVIKSSLSTVAPLEAILFDIDGTLCDSDPIHYNAFREMLQGIGFNGGEPISEEFFIKNTSGKHNEELCRVLFPEWNLKKARKFMDDKEEFF
ncbi:haloacid dehalogenase-like hydrolase domain-containing Sgpp [Olea europaea subsp. europaea]|uniref:Haloacid dehalogenase-like hydrolase domain-containing Sgpp n=1 Tax=Olea europaea subsp. europaea TaxID=158383 RepID=A0A8S0UZG4_OLEEU|nr:haloacid dehalogenase-like hydrolase domain-containing Sgpp [Olea europaea subsp. europaea]